MADRDGSGFLWFLAGLGVGAVVGVLYAPRAGEEMREIIIPRHDTILCCLYALPAKLRMFFERPL